MVIKRSITGKGLSEKVIGKLEKVIEEIYIYDQEKLKITHKLY